MSLIRQMGWEKVMKGNERVEGVTWPVPVSLLVPVCPCLCPQGLGHCRGDPEPQRTSRAQPSVSWCPWGRSRFPGSCVPPRTSRACGR